VYIDYDFENYTGAHSQIRAAAQSGATVTFNSNTYEGTTIDDFAIDGGKIMTKKQQAYGNWRFEGPAKECFDDVVYTVDVMLEIKLISDVRKILLILYGCVNLRITEIPYIKEK